MFQTNSTHLTYQICRVKLLPILKIWLFFAENLQLLTCHKARIFLWKFQKRCGVRLKKTERKILIFFRSWPKNRQKKKTSRQPYFYDCREGKLLMFSWLIQRTVDNHRAKALLATVRTFKALLVIAHSVFLVEEKVVFL